MTLKNTVGFPRATAQKVRVVVADPFPVILHGLRKMIEDDGRFQVVAAAHSVARFVLMVAVERPEIAVIDASLALESPELLQPLLRSKQPSTAVILLTSTKNTDENPEVGLLGARTVLSKWCTAEHLLETISSVCEAAAPVGSAKKIAKGSRGSVMACPKAPAVGVAQLTKRERQLLPLICKGMKNKEIAGHLGIAESTVWHHLTSIFTKLQVEDRLGLVTFAYRQGLVGDYDGASGLPAELLA